MNAIDELNRLLEETGLSPEDGKVASDIIDRIEREWIELPKDADDETIDKWISYAINRACTIEDQPDSWESIHDDLAMMSNDATAADIVHRCKALSERGA